MKKILLLVGLIICVNSAIAQREIDEDSKAFKDRVYFGGGLALSGGTSSNGYKYFYVAVSPTIGYMINNSLSVGTNITYQHYSYPDFNQTLDQYGFGPFIRKNFGQLFAYGEYQLLNTPSFDNITRRNYDRLLLGLGFTQPIGNKRGAINAMGLYDVLYNQSERVFASPWVFRVYFSF